MDFDIPWRRIATGAGVLLLHAIFLYILAVSMHVIRFDSNALHEIVFKLMPPNGSHTQQQDLHIPTPKMIRPEESEPSAITVLPTLNRELERPGNGVVPNFGGVGSYLYNCSGMFYEQLPANERAGCLLNRWDITPSNSPLLGVARQSPFDSVIAKRHEPDAAGTQHTCDQTAINSNLGLPCFNFDGQH